MDSYITYDKTLPIDMNGSNNPDLLTEVTYGEIGISPMVEKGGTGRMSPVRGRTMKEYDGQISELKKENFNLKLRIFFLEERLNTKYSGEDTIKTNIELKVEVESYKKDLQEKQQMLEKASETIDSMTAKYSEELEKEVLKISREFEDKLENSDKRVAELEDNLKDLEEQLKESEEALAGNTEQLTEQGQALEALNQDVEDRDGEIADLNGQLKACQQQLEEVQGNAGRQKVLYLEEIENLMTSDSRKDRDIQRLSILVKDRTSIEGITALERAHLQDAVEDANRRVAKLEKKTGDQERELGRRANMMGKMEDLLREKEHEKEDVSKAYDEKCKMYRKCKEQLAAFIKALHDKNAEHDELQEKNSNLLDTIQKLEEEITRLKQQLEQMRLDRQRDAEKAGELEQEMEGLARSLGKKEGELERFKELMETADRSLCESEEVVKSLERELVKVQNRSRGSGAGEDVGRLLREMEALQAQLQAKDDLYRAKCGELDAVATALNIQGTTATQTPAVRTDGKPDMLQSILDELMTLKEAVRSDRHLHISVSSAFQAQDGGMPKPDGNGSTSPRRDNLSNTFPGPGHQSRQPHPSSRIPVRKGSSTSSCSHDDVLDDLHRQVMEHAARNKHLEDTLKATEETVHCQTQKMKFYRNMLIEHDLLPRSRSRSNSMERDYGMSPRARSPSPRSLSPWRERSRSMDNKQRRPHSLDLRSRKTSGNNDHNDAMDKLATENLQLKQKVDGYKKVLKAFQDRSPSPQHPPGEKGEQESMGSKPVSSDSACRQLEGWLDMLDRFLLEVSQSDQCGSSPTVTSTTDVPSLRRGLIHARGAIQTLSETSLADPGVKEGKSINEGRLSPDSGCSDNNTASAAHTLKSPLVSPARSPCSTGSLHEKSPPSPLRLSTSPKTQTGSHSTSPRNLTGSHFNTSSKQCFPTDSLTDSHTDNKTKCFDIGSPSSVDQEFAQLPDRKFAGDQTTNQTSHSDRNMFPSKSSMHSIQSVEKLRHCSDFTNRGGVSAYSLDQMDNSLDNSAFIGDEFDLKLRDTMSGNSKSSPFRQTFPPDSVRSLGKPSHTYKNRDSLYKKTLTQTMISEALDDTIADKTLDEQFSQIDFNEHSMFDVTQDLRSEERAVNAELQEKVRSLEVIIASYQTGIQEKRPPDMMTLHQHLLELRQLRIQLEKSMHNNENLERLLDDLARSSESTVQSLRREIQDLHNQLAQSQHSIKEKVQRIAEKERLLSETNTSLAQLRDNSASVSADLQVQKEQVVSLELELKEKRARCDQLTALCQPLKNAVDQYKKRCELLETDNKKHVEAASKNQTRVQDLENELKAKSQSAEKIESQIDQLKNRIAELEADSDQYKKNENKYKNLLAQNRAQIAKLVSELEQVREEYKQLDGLREELEGTRDTIEEQDRQLFEKSLRIEQLTQEWNEKCEMIRVQDEERAAMRASVASGNELNKKLSTQLEQQRLNCANYKRQVDGQNHAMKDLKDKIDRLNDELAQHQESKVSVEKLYMDKQKELQETTRMRDKYLYNLKLMHKEFVKSKRDLQEMGQKFQNTSALNKSLTVELTVREKMQDKGDMLTDDDKENIIQELLNELKRARVQMTDILEQNSMIKQKMGQFLKENEAAKKSGSSSGTSKETGQSRLTEEFLEAQGSPSGANVTWPLFDDALQSSGKGGKSFRHSLPAREGTLEGAAADRSVTRSPNVLSQSVSSPGGNYFSVPGPIYKQGISDHCLLYNVNDSPKYVAGMTQFRIDSDLRSVFAIGMIDHFEKLHKETSECNILLKGLATRINERLKTFAAMPASQSMEYSTLKELSFSAEHMRLCVDSQQAMISCFWTSELPAPNDKGEFVNTKMVNENSYLKEQLSVMMAESGQSSARLDRVSREKTMEEEGVCRALASTLDIVSRAKTNLQDKSPPRNKPMSRTSVSSPRK